eukprot:gb/GECH01013050.1/.p1 GENE.gb/GECH01013050.1/~~gb/GECH01013050.1/.p1  ORF type:complete len:686 (+),score=141.01 gb/GECH01013050.1/:1-2058(+)
MNRVLKRSIVFLLAFVFAILLIGGTQLLFTASSQNKNTVQIKQEQCKAECRNGRCILGLCICDSGYQGKSCDKKSDTQSNYSIFGVIKSNNHGAKRESKNFFANNPSRFGKYRKLQPVSKALEICGGSSPEISRIVRNRPLGLEHLSLADPRILKYASKDSTKFESIIGRSPSLLNTKPENTHFGSDYELVVVAHGFSYCSQDGLRGMESAYEALKPGGYLVWEATLSDGEFGSTGSRIQFNTNFKNFFISFFKNKWKLEHENEDGTYEFYFIGQKPHNDIFSADYDDTLLVPPSTPKEQRVVLSSVLRTIRTSEIPIERTLIVGDVDKSVVELILLSSDNMEVFWFTHEKKPSVRNEIVSRLKTMDPGDLDYFISENMYSPLDLVVMDGINQPRFDPARLKLIVRDSQTHLLVVHGGDTAALVGWNSRVEDRMLIQTESQKYCLKGYMQLLTFVLYGYDPEGQDTRFEIIDHMGGFDHVQHIIFAWNNPKYSAPQFPKPIDNVLFTSLGSPIKSRFHAELPISTSSVAFSNDDVKVSHSSLKCLWKKHRDNPLSITGIEGTRVTISEDGEYIVMDSMDDKNQANLVLPEFMLFDQSHLRKYWNAEYSDSRQYVHRQEVACDDIFFNMVVYDKTGKTGKTFNVDLTYLDGELPPVDIDKRSECLRHLVNQGELEVPETFTSGSCQ